MILIEMQDIKEEVNLEMPTTTTPLGLSQSKYSHVFLTQRRAFLFLK